MTAQKLGRHALAVLVSVGVVFTLRTYVLSPYQVSSRSMQPTLADGDWILVEHLRYEGVISRKLSSLGFEPKINRGDIVLFSAANVSQAISQSDSLLIKRVVALEGDRVSIRDGVLNVDTSKKGSLTAESVPASDTGVPGWLQNHSEHFGPVLVPDDSVFVLGDNLSSSSDSRFFGPVSRRSIKGVVRWVHLRRGS